MSEHKFKSGFVTVIGRPNVGKSTLINTLLGEKVAITSPKPQTTRSNLRAIITEEEYQIIFIDTPGIHTPKSRLGEYMIKEAESTFTQVDAIVYINDITDKTILPGDMKILESIKACKAPVILVLNKIDIAPKERILTRISELTKDIEFAAVLPVSALKNDGLDLLKNEIIKLLPEGPQYYPGNIITDTTVREISGEIIREKILYFTKDEVPHGTGIEIIIFKDAPKSTGVCNIEANIYCEKQSHKAIIIGKDAALLKKIGTAARKDIEKVVGTRVNLKLWVKVKKDWRNNPGILRELGFKDK